MEPWFELTGRMFLADRAGGMFSQIQAANILGQAGADLDPNGWVWVRLTIGLLGGLALFLYGIEKLSDGLRAAAGDRLRSALEKLTANRFAGLFTGFAFTATIQSSSLTTVLVVSFISAGLLTLEQSVPVIIGSNIGTTLTAQLAAIKVTSAAWLMVALGVAARMWHQQDWTRDLGSILLGLGLLFVSIEQMSQATTPMQDSPVFIAWMQRLEYPWLGILVGTVFTAAIQSSSATSGIVIALAAQNLIQLPAAISIILGANLGTCITALLASIGKPAEARQAAVVHLLFNTIGVLVWSCFVPQLAALSQATSSELTRQVANAHTLFNVSTALVLIWFSPGLAALARKLVPSREQPRPRLTSAPVYLDETLLETPALAIDRVRREVGHLGILVTENLDRSHELVVSGSKEDLLATAAVDRLVNELHLSIINYSRRLARREITNAQSESLSDCTAAANYLENIGDIIATGLIHQGLRREENHLQIADHSQAMMAELHQQSRQSLERAILAFQNEDRELAQRVIDEKLDYQSHSSAVVDRLRVELIVDRGVEPILFQLEVDVINQYDRIHYLARRIARLVVSKGA